MPVMNINLFSITLRYGIDCMVVLPENLKKEEKLKCLWLYHGGSGDHTAWLYHTPLVELAEEKHFAAVLPNVHEYRGCLWYVCGKGTAICYLEHVCVYFR